MYQEIPKISVETTSTEAQEMELGVPELQFRRFSSLEIRRNISSTSSRLMSFSSAAADVFMGRKRRVSEFLRKG
ncbi:unnamed protein product [Caenorhabditis angaria]|uniref:Uncharacterized protein n=1 Tax=Caenorhabditis angaria TaxID=860376 RepID=A0A9P1IAA4_9PELO|nr:unnamed protein product [Caenorhabditis angaria]